MNICVAVGEELQRLLLSHMTSNTRNSKDWVGRGMFTYETAAKRSPLRHRCHPAPRQPSLPLLKAATTVPLRQVGNRPCVSCFRGQVEGTTCRHCHTNACAPPSASSTVLPIRYKSTGWPTGQLLSDAAVGLLSAPSS